ncbi:uncharacterized protein LOC132194000 isoform X2 [Neocloeon triangulifer]|uniref:uncharacterized protein LOC132194000 isoform X2 n=1 Tax=Neocloeon triangulifer TaxID=2078957 RepID=UPI00286EE73F|nr:uncharacterized protein LOC132194000 isoform X2 [Neocloeon triangulifer]
MARFFLLIVLLFAAVLANASSHKVVETRKVAEEQTKLANATNDKLDQLAKNVDQHQDQTMERIEEAAKENKQLLKTVNERLDNLENQNNQTLEDVKRQNQKLDELSKIAERLVQLFEEKFSPQESPCNLSRSASLKTLSNGKKYHFNKTAITWAGANETCSQMGLHMATITNLTDAQVILEEGEKSFGGHNWWTSATNQASEKDFRWHDGTKLDLDSSLWRVNADKTEDCVYIADWVNGKLSTWLCSGKSNLLCELPGKCY